MTAKSPSEYLVAIPRKAAATIQNRAPGPPAQTAVATPTILPVPIVALKAVQRAAKLEISPSASSSFWIIHFSARGSFRICNRPRRTVSSRPPAMISTINGTPQTKLSTLTRKSLITLHMFLILYLSFNIYIECMQYHRKISCNENGMMTGNRMN